MHNEYKVAAFFLSLLLAACSGGGGPTPSIPKRSAQILSEPPDMIVEAYWRTDTAQFPAALMPTYQVFGSPTSSDLIFWAGDAAFDQVCLPLPGTGCLWCGTWRDDGDTVFLVVVLDANEVSTLYAARDNDGDGIPDASSFTAVVSTSPNVGYVIDVTHRSEDGTIYLLDVRTQDILTSHDTSGDGWPDAAPTPFALSATHPDLVRARSLVNWDLDGVGVFAAANSDDVTYSNLSEAMGEFYMDTDGDRVADLVEGNERDSIAPAVRGTPYVGQTEIWIDGGFGGEGKVVEIWSLDGDENRQSLIGSATLPAEGDGFVTLTRALALGERIGVSFLPEDPEFPEVTEMSHIVRPAYPQILGVEPTRILGLSLDQPQVVTLRGYNFASDTEVTIRDLADNVVTVPFIFVNECEGTITIPPQGATADPGSIGIWATSPTQPAEDGATTATVDIGVPETP